MGWSHAPETAFWAEELYCLDRLPMAEVAAKTNVGESTLWRWAQEYGWAAKREQYFKEQGEIRLKTLTLRRRLIENCLESLGAFDAFAVAKMEEAALKARNMALKERAAAKAENLPLPEDPLAALDEAVNRRLAQLLADPGQVNFQALRDLKQGMELVGEMKAKTGKDEAKRETGGLTAERLEELFKKLGVK